MTLSSISFAMITAVAHPAWCDLTQCDLMPDHNDEVLILHCVTVGRPGGVIVQTRRADVLTTTGAVVGAAHIQVGGITGRELTPDEAVQLAGAIGAAAGHATLAAPAPATEAGAR